MSPIIFPLHLRGLKGLIGEIDNFFESKLSIGPCTDRLYAVLPAGVETKTPSLTSFFIIIFLPFKIFIVAACLLCLSADTSLIAIEVFILLFFFFNHHF